MDVEGWYDVMHHAPQVSVTPGGRWNQFKTYSVVQRTFEIWSFVITFLVRVRKLKKSAGRR